ncbi:hypothetical protein [Undibacterium sp. Xuan67W]|uniref:hypothetical protein n=1 Tax=Undibacterium sp. Xuan67W TaxID=3413057 RepID=UPI003BF0DCB0
MSSKFTTIKAARRSYRPEIKPASFEALPFVLRLKRSDKKLHNKWHVIPTDDYGLACANGTEYAAHFAQYLKDNPCMVGSNLLGNIVADIDFSDTTATKGYWVGLFSHLERLIYAAARDTDVFANVDEVHAFNANLRAKIELETQENTNANYALAQSQKIKLPIENAQTVISDANMGDDHANVIAPKTSKTSSIRTATKSDAKSLLDSLSEDEIKFMMNVRSLCIAHQEHLRRIAQALRDKRSAETRPALSIVKTASISSIDGGDYA